MTDTQLSATVPEEPPDGSVVLDRAKRAWQRAGNTWYRAAAGAPSLFGNGGGKWPWLLFDCGPVTPLWTPPPADVAAADDDEDDTETPGTTEDPQAAEGPLLAPLGDVLAAAGGAFAVEVPVEPLPDAVVVHVPPSTLANPAGFVGFTRHGHAVGGLPPADTPWPCLLARCTGGPGCHQCRADAAQLLRGRSVPADQSAAAEQE